jgi:glutamine cyclotransferase
VRIGALAAAAAIASSPGVAHAATAPVAGYRVVRVYPHDPDAFTEGLAYAHGALYEGTGSGVGDRSVLRRVDLATGRARKQRALPADQFGEGIAVVGDRIFQLTWLSHTGYVYDRRRFQRLTSFTYPTEGWGLTTDGRRLIMSDGSATLFFRDPKTFAETGRIDVRDGDAPVDRLNELECIAGEIWANVLPTDRIARIDPASGQVVGWVDLSGLLPVDERPPTPEAILNGIAYDQATGRIFVTGKLWPKLFQIEVVPAD